MLLVHHKNMSLYLTKMFHLFIESTVTPPISSHIILVSVPLTDNVITPTFEYFRINSVTDPPVTNSYNGPGETNLYTKLKMN